MVAASALANGIPEPRGRSGCPNRIRAQERTTGCRASTNPAGRHRPNTVGARRRPCLSDREGSVPDGLAGLLNTPDFVTTVGLWPYDGVSRAPWVRERTVHATSRQCDPGEAIAKTWPVSRLQGRLTHTNRSPRTPGRFSGLLPWGRQSHSSPRRTAENASGSRRLR